MRKIIKRTVLVIVALIMIFLLFIGGLALSAVIQGNSQEADNARQQVARIEALEADYADGSAVKVNEESFLGFEYSDIGNIRYNSLRTLGSHNSYKKEYSTSAKLFSKIAFPIIGMGANDSDYYHENFTDQLNMGLRTFELDIAKYTSDDGDYITAIHAPYFDGNSWASDFSLALKEFALWSRYNAGHMPITLLLEVKTDFLLRPSIKALKDEDVEFIENIITEALGDRLMTPSDMLALSGAESIADMRESGTYPYLNQMTDKIMCILHPGSLSDGYSERGVDKAKMFLAGSKYSDSVFDVLNNPNQVERIQKQVDAGFIVRTRMDEYSRYSDEKHHNALLSKAQILSSDYVPRVNPKAGEYVCVLTGGKTMLKN